MTINRDLFIITDKTISADDFFNIKDKYLARFETHRRIIMQAQSPLDLNAAMIAAREAGKELFVCHRHFKEDEMRQLYRKHECDLMIIKTDKAEIVEEDRPGIETSGRGFIYVFTSGTTGEAKIARHRWDSIEHSSAFVGDRLKNKCWMMCYSPTSYAGLQVFFSAFNNNGKIYYPPSNYEQIARGMAKNEVRVVSATPTFWRLLITSWPEDLPAVKLEQATLGGEIITQDILDAIKKRFRPERITHIYASTEAGTAIIVSDGLAGFPEKLLDTEKGVSLRIVDDLLEIKAPGAMEGYLGRESNISNEGWVMTGDMVESREGRIFFLGRADGMINVGGMKVLPEEVEGALNSLEEIRDSRVYAKRSPIIGSLVMAEVVLNPGTAFDELSIKNRLKNILADYKIPKVIVQTEEIGISEHGKKLRK